MASFTTESAVRLKFQFHDASMVSTELVEQCIADAHTELLVLLEPEFEQAPYDNALVMGETLLAGALVFRALASHQAVSQRQATIGGQRIEEGQRCATLLTLASITETQAWLLLAPYCSDAPAGIAVGATDSIPILGED